MKKKKYYRHRKLKKKMYVHRFFPKIIEIFLFTIWQSFFALNKNKFCSFCFNFQINIPFKYSAMSSTSKTERNSLSQVKDTPPATPTAAIINANTNLLILANKNDFYRILKENQNRLLLIEFFANWCGPCQTLVGSGA